jgi:shikimate dehydrogenase
MKTKNNEETMIQLGLIGAGISKSSAPRLHAFLGRMYGVPVDYQRIDSNEIAGFEFTAALTRCTDAGYRGVNVTHPYKEQTRKKVEVPDPSVARIGAINTVIFEADGWKGFNTDFSGFAGAFRHRFGDASPGTALIVGSGGVGKAMAFSLARLGAKEIWLHDIERARARDLTATLRTAGIDASMIESADLADAMRKADGLLNGTPLGMYQHPGNAFPVAAIGGQRWVFDAVYTPLETEFLKCAKAKSIDILSGYHLFLFQGFDAFTIFTGVAVDAEAAMKAFPPPDALSASPKPTG